MQRFAVIGLGRFGLRLARALAAAGREVIAIDTDRAVIDGISDDVTLAVAMDATDEAALRKHSVDKVDVVVVAIAGNFEATALTTVLLKQLGVKRVISRAHNPVSARILSSIGADSIVNPEDESADRWAVRLVSPHFLNHFGLDADYSIVEIQTPAQWVDQTLLTLQLRTKHKVHVVAIKRVVNDNPNTPQQRMVYLPDPMAPLHGDDLLVLMGNDDALAQLPIDTREAADDQSR